MKDKRIAMPGCRKENRYMPSPIERSSLQALSRRSNAAGLLQLGGHLLLLAVGAWAIHMARGSLWVWPAMWVYGILLTFLFTPLHECIHRTAFKARALNGTVAFIAGALLLLPAEYFRAFHFAHHRFTQDPARDPELAFPKPANRRAWLWHVSGIPYWIGQGRGLVTRALGRAPETFYKDETQRRAVIREARVMLGVYGVILILSLATGSTVALFYWVIPALLGQPALRLYLLAEHALCPLSEDMLENTRTTHTNAAVRFVAWNMPYHAEHHAHPAVPFHRLPDLHRQLGPHLKMTSPGYWAVQRAILRSFKEP
jgi:fatty acid desaturase